MTAPKTVQELEALIRRAAAKDEPREMDVLIQARLGKTPNWDCKVQYTDADHGWGPGPGFIQDVAELKRRFHLQE